MTTVLIPPEAYGENLSPYDWAVYVQILRDCAAYGYSDGGERAQAERAGISRTAARKALAHLVESGLITKTIDSGNASQWSTTRPPSGLPEDHPVVYQKTTGESSGLPEDHPVVYQKTTGESSGLPEDHQNAPEPGKSSDSKIPVVHQKTTPQSSTPSDSNPVVYQKTTRSDPENLVVYEKTTPQSSTPSDSNPVSHSLQTHTNTHTSSSMIVNSLGMGMVVDAEKERQLEKWIHENRSQVERAVKIARDRGKWDNDDPALVQGEYVHAVLSDWRAKDARAQAKPKPNPSPKPRRFEVDDRYRDVIIGL